MKAIRTVNANGLLEIKEFLCAYHKLGKLDGTYFDQGMLRAWAADAEYQLREGNAASIEISRWNSVTGATVTYTVSDAGLDEEVEIDD